MGSHALSIWQVWWFNQDKSRALTYPQQPTDDSKRDRMYVVIAPTQNAWNKVTCCPVQNKDPQKPVGLTEVELLLGYKTIKLIKDSRILCHEIYTLPKDCFFTQAGTLLHPEQIKVKTAISLYLRLP